MGKHNHHSILYLEASAQFEGAAIVKQLGSYTQSLVEISNYIIMYHVFVNKPPYVLACLLDPVWKNKTKKTVSVGLTFPQCGSKNITRVTHVKVHLVIMLPKLNDTLYFLPQEISKYSCWLTYCIVLQAKMNWEA